MMKINRSGTMLKPDASRVLFRPFNPTGEERPLRLLARILSLPEAEAGERRGAPPGKRHP